MSIRAIILQFKILELEIKDVFHSRVNSHGWQFFRGAAQLQINLLKMVIVQMCITQGMHKVAIFEVANLRHHHGQQGIGSDIERHTQEYIGTALVKLGGQFAICHIKLE